MKLFVITFLVVLALVVPMKSFSQNSEESLQKVQVMLDKKVIKPAEIIQVNKDETYQINVAGLKPGSTVYINVKKAGIRLGKAEHKADENGKAMKLVDTPAGRATFSCKVTYINADNSSGELKFKLKVK